MRKPPALRHGISEVSDFLGLVIVMAVVLAVEGPADVAAQSEASQGTEHKTPSPATFPAGPASSPLAPAPKPPVPKPPSKLPAGAPISASVAGGLRAPIVILQAGRKAQSATLNGLASPTTATLVTLAPANGAWYLLELAPAAGQATVYHLESKPRTRIALEAGGVSLLLTHGDTTTRCTPWNGPDGGDLAQARRSGLPFAPLCGGRIYLRNQVTGNRSSLERTTDFIRDHVKGGEAITSFVKDTVFKDRYLRTTTAERSVRQYVEPAGAPPPVAISPLFAEARISPIGLAVALDGVQEGRLEVGRWYLATGFSGIFVSALEAGQVPAVRQEVRSLVSPLDGVENTALTYLVAYDLAHHEPGFSLGTDHPRLGWSDRVPPEVRGSTLLGPDGIDTSAPLVRTGVVPPHRLRRVTSTFTGGFKRSHGAFKYGELALKNRGSHYGFVESGTVFSRLQPDLATVVMWADGLSEILTWRRELEARLGEVRHARQNGVPLVETDPATGKSRPGKLVSRWGEGNWSGSEGKNLRSLRAGLCQVEAAGRRYFIYGYFSGATPSAMARVFLSAGCQSAIHLDMNALEHTYLALYRVVEDRFLTEHLIDGMAVLDTEKNGSHLPRFVTRPDSRDFFYFLRKEGASP